MRRRAFTLIELLVVIAIIAILAAILFPVFAKARDRAQTAACLSNMNQIGKGLMMYCDDNEQCYPINRFFTTGSPYTWKRALTPYMKSIDVWRCPANRAQLAAGSRLVPFTLKIGDESNALDPAIKVDKSRWLPSGYGYNGGYFHEQNGVRNTSKIKSPATLMVILECRTANPDLGPWTYNWTTDATGALPADAGNGGKFSAFFTHNKRMNIVFADGHAQAYSLPEVYQKNLWGVPETDGYLASGRAYSFPNP